MIVRRLAVLVAALVLSFVAAQTLVVYSSVDEENANRILAAFTADTGIPVQMVFLSSGPALSPIEAERTRPVEEYARPVDRFVADFKGKANFIEATALGAHAIEVGGARLEVPNGVPHAAGTIVTAAIRPEALTIERGTQVAAPLRGVVERASFLGQLTEIVVRAPGGALWMVDVPNAAELGMPEVGETLGLVPSPRSLPVLPR